MDAIETDIGKLPMSAIITHVGGMMKLSHEERAKKTLLLNRVLRDAPHAVLLSLQRAGLAHKQLKHDQCARKRPHADDEVVSRKAAHTDEHKEVVSKGHQTLEAPDTFLQVPTTEEVEEIYKAFYLATGTKALQSDTCGVCARECSVCEDGLQHVKVTDIPNPARLRPKKAHPNHRLVNDMLLEPMAITQEGAHVCVNICRQCMGELWKTNRTPPRLSLANQLWIGECPWVLQCLTFPEQLLIALLYLRVYVFKLFPKRSGAVRDVSSLQNAMRGNVCSFDHNMDAIAVTSRA